MTLPIQSQEGTPPPFSFPNSYGTSPTNAPAGTPQVGTQEEDVVELVDYPSTRPSPGQLSPAFPPPNPNEPDNNRFASRVTSFPPTSALTSSPVGVASPPTTPIMHPSLDGGNAPINSAVVTVALATLSLTSTNQQQRAPSSNSTSSRSESAVTTPGSRGSRHVTLALTPVDYVQE